MPFTARQQQIIESIKHSASASVSELQASLETSVSIATLNRDLASLVTQNALLKIGKGRAIRYTLSPSYYLFAPINLTAYFETETDQRNVNEYFNYDIIEVLTHTPMFTDNELTHLTTLQERYLKNTRDYPDALYQKEIERLTIELSWKSSQIEGNTYSLLETERLFKEKQAVDSKPKEDATMLLNHKEAFSYLLEHRDVAQHLSLRFIEELHSLLIQDLDVGKNLRSRMVGITGTSYKPLDNQHQIRDAMEAVCNLINAKANGFEKALLAVVLISYIQPFEDGNKRTGRLLGNALLLAHQGCPLSYRSVDSLEYKKAMLLFYEQNNLSAFKHLFLEQIAFSVNTYFQ